MGRKPKQQALVVRRVALCYIRKSMVRDEADLHSPERQRRNLLAWCELHGYTPEFYEDTEGHRSGRQEAGRPGWQQLKSQLRRPDVAAVVVETISRSHRNLKELLSFIDEAQEAGVIYASIQEGFDASTAMGRMLISILGTFAEGWSNITSQKMSETVLMLRNDGRHWGTMPFGVERQQGKLFPDKGGLWYRHNGHGQEWTTEQPEGEGWLWRGYHGALRRLYELYAEGPHGYGRVAGALNAEGWRHKNRKGVAQPFGIGEVRGAIESWELYVGILRTKEGEMLSEQAWAPVLDESLIQRAVEVSKGKGKKASGRPPKQQPYELSPLLHCAQCKQQLTGLTNRLGTRTYRHHNGRQACPTENGSVSADAVEAEVYTLLASLDVSRDFEELLKTEAERQAGKQAPANDDGARLEMLRGRLERLQDLYLAGHLQRSRYHSQATELQGEIEALEQRVGAEVPLSVGEVAGRIREMNKLLGVATPEERKILIAAFIDRLEVNPDNGQVTYWPARWAESFFP